MSSLLWFHGIHWDTEIGRIGWTWLILAVCIVTFIILSIQLVTIIRGK